MWASFHPFYTVLKGNSVISKYKRTSLWNFVLNTGLRKFCHGISIVETCYKLSSRKVDAQSVINWAVVPLVYRTDRQALSTALFCRTDQLATADTWFRTSRTSTFCAVAWQLARFQLTQGIAQSLSDSWASCYYCKYLSIVRDLVVRVNDIDNICRLLCCQQFTLLCNYHTPNITTVDRFFLSCWL